MWGFFSGETLPIKSWTHLKTGLNYEVLFELLLCNFQPVGSDIGKLLILHSHYRNGHIINELSKFLGKKKSVL